MFMHTPYLTEFDDAQRALSAAAEASKARLAPLLDQTGPPEDERARVLRASFGECQRLVPFLRRRDAAVRALEAFGLTTRDIRQAFAAHGKSVSPAEIDRIIGNTVRA